MSLQASRRLKTHAPKEELLPLTKEEKRYRDTIIEFGLAFVQRFIIVGTLGFLGFTVYNFYASLPPHPWFNFALALAIYLTAMGMLRDIYVDYKRSRTYNVKKIIEARYKNDFYERVVLGEGSRHLHSRTLHFETEDNAYSYRRHLFMDPKLFDYMIRELRSGDIVRIEEMKGMGRICDMKIIESHAGNFPA